VSDEPRAPDREYPVNAVHLMRTVQLSQLQLSSMADAKASLLMGAAFVIFTITIGQARHGTPPLPLLILGGAAFLAAICAVLAVLPRVGGRKPKGEPNILFFGTFARMEEEAFIETLLAELGSDDSIYRAMARDIYQAGKVLQDRKYRMLIWAYRVFLAGLAASFTAFVLLYLVRI
jgi:Family of unknown function (DUF5706)